MSSLDEAGATRRARRAYKAATPTLVGGTPADQILENSYRGYASRSHPFPRSSLCSQFQESKALPSRLRYAFMGVEGGWGPATTRVRADKDRPQLPAQALPRRPRHGRATRPQIDGRLGRVSSGTTNHYHSELWFPCLVYG